MLLLLRLDLLSLLLLSLLLGLKLRLALLQLLLLAHDGRLKGGRRLRASRLRHVLARFEADLVAALAVSVAARLAALH